MKYIFSIALLLVAYIGIAQNSNTRKFITDANTTLTEKDFNKVARFTSGIGESVTFFPVKITELQTKESINAVQVDFDIKNGKIEFFSSYYLDIIEVKDFITFLEKYTIPNIDLKLNNQSIEFEFKGKELWFRFRTFERKQRITMSVRDYDNEGINRIIFWTETQVDKIPRLLKTLKELEANNFEFEIEK